MANIKREGQYVELYCDGNFVAGWDINQVKTVVENGSENHYLRMSVAAIMCQEAFEAGECAGKTYLAKELMSSLSPEIRKEVIDLSRGEAVRASATYHGGNPNAEAIEELLSVVNGSKLDEHGNRADDGMVWTDGSERQRTWISRVNRAIRLLGHKGDE